MNAHSISAQVYSDLVRQCRGSSPHRLAKHTSKSVWCGMMMQYSPAEVSGTVLALSFCSKKVKKTNLVFDM